MSWHCIGLFAWNGRYAIAMKVMRSMADDGLKCIDVGVFASGNRFWFRCGFAARAVSNLPDFTIYQPGLAPHFALGLGAFT